MCSKTDAKNLEMKQQGRLRKDQEEVYGKMPCLYSQTCVQRLPSGPQICGRCSGVGLCYKETNWDTRMMVFVDRWSLAQV